MRRFVVSTLDFLAIAAVVVATLWGASRGSWWGLPGLLIGGGAAFILASLGAGVVLALTEIARNTRRLVELAEGKPQA